MNWFRFYGAAVCLGGFFFSYLLRSHFTLQLSQIAGRLNRGFWVLTTAYGLALILSGAVLFLLSRKAAEGEKTAQLGIRLSSLYIFLSLGAMLYLGIRHFAVYSIILGTAINLVGLCPLCTRRKTGLFSPERPQDGLL
jgi:hypothetical protein